MSNFLNTEVQQVAWALSPFVVVIALLGSVMAAEEHYVANGYGLSGHDPVAYFTVGQPVEGDSRYVANHNGITYRFSSADNLKAFSKDPEAYVPAYGGFCAFGTAMGRKFPGDPTAWKIVDGRLYLNLNKTVQKQWVENIPGFIKGAESNWPIIRTVTDADLASNAPDGLTLGAQ
jgi:YHS domain-containing protein